MQIRGKNRSRVSFAVLLPWSSDVVNGNGAITLRRCQAGTRWRCQLRVIRAFAYDVDLDVRAQL